MGKLKIIINIYMTVSLFLFFLFILVNNTYILGISDIYFYFYYNVYEDWGSCCKYQPKNNIGIFVFAFGILPFLISFFMFLKNMKKYKRFFVSWLIMIALSFLFVFLTIIFDVDQDCFKPKNHRSNTSECIL